MGRDPPLGPTTYPVAGKDKAQDFDGSDGETLTHTGTMVSGGGIAHLKGQASRPADGSSASTSGQWGIRVEPQDTIHALTLTVSANTSGLTRVQVVRVSDGTLMSEQTGLSLGAGDTLTLSATLDPTEQYDVLGDAAGSSYTRGYYGSASYRYTSAAVDMTAGVDGSGSTYSSSALLWADITGETTSGTAYVEWSMPPDVYAWDVAQFLAERDTATVDVYAEENQAGGWTEVAGPLKRGERIPADAANNVRYRVELSRPSTSENPRLESLYRRFKL